MINQQTIENIKSSTDIMSVISQFVKLTKKGMDYRGLCPFHQESDPSFSVSPSKGIYKCFSCGETGDVITFLMRHEAMTFEEAVRWLAQNAGIEIDETLWSAGEKRRYEDRECFFLLNDVAAEHFISHVKCEEAQTFLSCRRIDAETAARFRLGFAPRTNNLLLRTFLRKGYSEELLEVNGLVFKTDPTPGLMDRFRNRVIFPIRNLSGRTVAFGGRLIDNNPKVAKYHNSPESIYYRKGKELYGLFEGKRAIMKEGNCFLVEGYTDVLRMSAMGVEETVAPLGTAMTPDQIKLLKRFTRCVTIMTDGDDAGRKSALNMLKLFLSEGLDVYIFPLPQGEDPDSYCKNIPQEELRTKLYHERRDALLYFAVQIWSNSGEDVSRKSRALKDIVELLSRIADPVRRYFYVEQIAALTGFRDVRALDPKSYELNAPQMVLTKENKLTTREKTERRLLSWLIYRGSERISILLEKNKIWQSDVREFVDEMIESEGIQWKTALFERIWEELHKESPPAGTPVDLYYMHHPDMEIAELIRELVPPVTDDVGQELRIILISMKLSDISASICESCPGLFHQEDIELNQSLIVMLKREWYALRKCLKK